MLVTVSGISSRRGTFMCREYEATLMASPGHRATVLLALASTGGTPTKIITGKEMKLPPPATALIVPAIAPVNKRMMACLKCKPGMYHGDAIHKLCISP